MSLSKQDAFYIQDVGTGPAVMLLHGAPTDTADFDRMIASLSASHRVLCPDLPGYSRSRGAAGLEGLFETESLLARSLEARGIDEVTLVGVSCGAYRAFSLALSGRVKVSAVVSLGGFAGLPADARERMKQVAALIRSGADLGSVQMKSMFTSQMLSPAHAARHPRDVERTGQWLQLMPPGVLARELEDAAACVDLYERLANASFRVLARVGELDVCIPPSLSEKAVASTPGAVLDVVPGAGHVLLVEDGPATVSAVSAFLEAQSR